MAEPKYKPKKGTTRTPEEHRKILQEIDILQKKRSAIGVHKSKARIFNTFGVSSTQFKKKRKPYKERDKIYQSERFARE